jgi:Mce-associated membrane protein
MAVNTTVEDRVDDAPPEPPVDAADEDTPGERPGDDVEPSGDVPPRRRTAVLGAIARLPRRGAAAMTGRVERNPRRVMAVAVAIAVLAGAGAIGAWMAGHAVTEAAAQRNAARDVAVENVPALLSYDPRTVDRLVDERGAALSEGFRRDYGTLISQVVAPTAKKSQVTTKAEVVGSGMVVDGPRDGQVVALLFVNQSTRSPAAPTPVRSGSRVRVVLDHVDDAWLISDVKPV